MSLKQYNPHLQLTIHRPVKLVWALRLFSGWLITMLLLTELHHSHLLFAGIAVLLADIGTERSLVFHQGMAVLNEFTFSFAKEDYELDGLRVLFGYLLLIRFTKGRKPLLLSRDQLSGHDWQCLVRYSKLQG